MCRAIDLKLFNLLFHHIHNLDLHVIAHLNRKPTLQKNPLIRKTKLLGSKHHTCFHISQFCSCLKMQYGKPYFLATFTFFWDLFIPLNLVLFKLQTLMILLKNISFSKDASVKQRLFFSLYIS